MTETRLVGAWQSLSLAEILHPPVSESALSHLPFRSLSPSNTILDSASLSCIYAYTPIHKDMFPFRTTQKQGPRVDLLMSPDGFADSEPHRAEEQRANQPSPAIFAQSRASSQAAYYHHYHYHGEEHGAVPERDEDGTSGIESTYSFVSPSEAASSRTDGSEADGSAGSGKRSRFPKFKLSLTAAPPKPKPKPKPKKPPTPRSAVSFGRGGAGNAIRVASNKSPTTPTTAKSHRTFNSDPSIDDRLSTHTGRTGATLDSTLGYTSDTGTYTPPRSRASRWSFEPSRNQGATRRSSLDSGWIDNGSFERYQYPTHLEVSTSTGFVGQRSIATTLPNIPPETGRLRQEEEQQSLRDPSGSVMQSPRPTLADDLTELGELTRTSPDHRVIRPSSPSGSDHQFSPTAPPPSYDEATDSHGRSLGPGNRLQYDGPHVGPHHATYGGPLHHGMYQGSRAFPTMPHRYDGRTTPMESAYLGHTRPVEGRLPWLHQQSMEKSAVAIAEASEYTTERPHGRHPTTQHTNVSLYHQDPAPSKSFHRLEFHLEGSERPSPHVLENENNTTPCDSAVRYPSRSVTPALDSTRARSPGGEAPVPNHLDDTPTFSRAPVVTTHVPSSPLLLPLPLPATAMQAESEGTQETPPKQLSKMERALLRRAVVGMKVDNPRV